MANGLEKKQLGGLFKALKSGIKAGKSAYKAERAGKTLADLKEVEKTVKKVKTPPATKLDKSRASALKKYSKEVNKPATKAKTTKSPESTPGVKDLKEVKVSAPKTKGKKLTKKELAAKQTRDEKIAKRVLTGAGVIGGGSMLGYGLFGGKKKKKAIDDPLFQKQLKQYDDSLKKARGYGSGMSSLIKKKSGGSTNSKSKKR